MAAQVKCLHVPYCSSQPLYRSSHMRHFLVFNTKHNNPRKSSHSFSLRIQAAADSAPSPPPPLSDQLRVESLSESLPYIRRLRRLRGNTVVVKYGGAATKSVESVDSLVRDLVLLSYLGLRLVLVQGDCPKIHVDGKLFLTADTLATRICQAGSSALGIAGPFLLSAKTSAVLSASLNAAQPGSQEITILQPGELSRVDPTLVQQVLSLGDIPVIGPIAEDLAGTYYKVNANMVAGELAAALGAQRLILMADAAGISEDGSVKVIDVRGARKMILEGKVADEIVPMVDCCLLSLAKGVGTASIIDGRLNHSLLRHFMTDDGAGTLVFSYLPFGISDYRD